MFMGKHSGNIPSLKGMTVTPVLLFTTISYVFVDKEISIYILIIEFIMVRSLIDYLITLYYY